MPVKYVYGKHPLVAELVKAMGFGDDCVELEIHLSLKDLVMIKAKFLGNEDQVGELVKFVKHFKLAEDDDIDTVEFGG